MNENEMKTPCLEHLLTPTHCHQGRLWRTPTSFSHAEMPSSRKPEEMILAVLSPQHNFAVYGNETKRSETNRERKPKHKHSNMHLKIRLPY